MLTCIPESLCSWNYRIIDEASDSRSVRFRRFYENGTIVLNGAEYAIQKQGLFNGRWTLERDGEIVADAKKSFLRRFDVEIGQTHLTVKAKGPFTRCYEILMDDEFLGTIRPIHAFTRRATIDCQDSVPEIIQLFAFWLAVLTWRRAAQNNNSPPG